MEYIKRDYYIDLLAKLKDSKLIKVITGARRVGKTTILFELYKDYLLSVGVDISDIVVFKVDQVHYSNIRNSISFYKKYNKIFNSRKKYIFFDEIQLISNFEELLNTISADGHDIYVTGSNSRLLSFEISTLLRGRTFEIKVYPLSYLELYPLFNDYSRLLEFMFRYGSLPEVYSQTDDKIIRGYLKTYDFDIIYKDIFERYSVLHKEQFLKTLNLLFQSVGQRISANRIANLFRYINLKSITVDTVIDYLYYLKTANIILEAKRLNLKSFEQITSNSKYYAFDCGVRNQALNYFKLDYGVLLENLVYTELIRRYGSVFIGDIDNKEIDFIINPSNNRYYIQVCYDISSEDTLIREITPFKLIRDSFKKIIITNTKLLQTRDELGICYIHIHDFLIDYNSLEKL